MERLRVVDHPLFQQRLTLLRDKKTDSPTFRVLLREASIFLIAKATEDLPTKAVKVETPLGIAEGRTLAVGSIVAVPVLRAGLAMVDAFLELIPDARLGHLGLFRDPSTHRPVEYYSKLPDNLEQVPVFILDPMVATGGSAVAAIDAVKKAGARSVRLVSLLAAPEGVRAVSSAHPDVDIFTGSLDERLDERAYIIPGLGDAGDRVFGT
jgi:uracil phosphoribosyltransferase